MHRLEITNTGQGTDIIRLAASTEAGWETTLEHAFIEVPAGATVEVPVYVALPVPPPSPPKGRPSRRRR